MVGPLRAPYLSTTTKLIDDDETVDAVRVPGKGIRRRPRGAADSQYAYLLYGLRAIGRIPRPPSHVRTHARRHAHK